MTFNKICKPLLVLLITALHISDVKAETKDQHLKVVFRTIGHEFLLQLDDSTSRILAIEEIDGRYAMKFEEELFFEPDFLSFAVYKVLAETEILDSFIVEVEKCETKEVIHSFKAGLKKGNGMTACKLRALPKDCYTIYFTVIGGVEDSPTNQSTSSFGLNYWYLIIILILIVGGFVYAKKRNTKLNADLINIGQYQFDQKGMLLTLKAQSVELSAKESDLLLLLFSNENKTLEREYILNVVWQDGGDYVGRTLDVFISKLRKKLAADSSLKIINVRGVGYRFVINNMSSG